MLYSLPARGGTPSRVNGLAAERMKGASALPCRGSWIAGGAGARAFDPARKARLKGEPGTLQFEVLLPEDDDTKVLSFEMYRDAAAFEVHLKGPAVCCWPATHCFTFSAI